MRPMSFTVLALCVLSPLLSRADDPEPPGKGGAELRKLRGKWVVDRAIFAGKESKPNVKVNITYTFDGDKVTYDNGKTTYVSKIKLDTKKKPFVMEVTREDTKLTRKWVYKIEKDELHLVTVLKGDPKDEDLSGKNSSVLIFTREKK